MDTGGKIATGVLVPLGIIGIAAGGYYIYYTEKKNRRQRSLKREGYYNLLDDHNKSMTRFNIKQQRMRDKEQDLYDDAIANEKKELLRNIDTSLFNGGKRRTHLRRR